MSYRARLYLYSVLFIVIFSIYYIDIPLAKFFYNNTTPSISKVFSYITELGSFIYIVLINIVILGILFFSFKVSNNKKYIERTRLMFYGILAQGISALVVQLLKFIFGRVRPFYYLSHIYGNSNTFTFFNFNEAFVSFPSGHSAGIWALITCLMIVFKDKRYIKLLVIPGILVPMSRMVLNMHYFSDILVGALFGIFIPYLLMKKFLNKSI